jgi:hypothetical protein
MKIAMPFAVADRKIDPRRPRAAMTRTPAPSCRPGRRNWSGHQFPAACVMTAQAA